MDAHKKTIDDFNHLLEDWLEQLENYSFDQLMLNPSPTSWSMGQLYVHLIQASRYFIQQIKIAASNNDNKDEVAVDAAKMMFENNDFPDALLDGPPTNAITPQPESKEYLKTELIRLKDKMMQIEELVAQSPFNGKTKHFALGYFSAKEWLQFAEMHLRHHLRQKKRLDEFLKIEVEQLK